MKKTFEKANELYASIGRLVANGIDPSSDLSGTYDEYNRLIEENDFSNIIFTGETGLKGVKWCYGEIMIPAEYEEIMYLSIYGVPTDECFAIAKRDGVVELINGEGTAVFKADDLRPCESITNWFFYMKGQKWGVVNKGGKVVFDAQFDDIRSGCNGFNFVWLDNKEGFIDPWGNLIEPKFEKICIDETETLVVTYNGQQGFVDEDGEFVTDRRDAYYNLEIIF